MDEAKGVAAADALEHGGLVQFAELAHVQAQVGDAGPLQALPGHHLLVVQKERLWEFGFLPNFIFYWSPIQYIICFHC
jgi:hypothetical protein